MELQQSPAYAKYIAALRWSVLRVDDIHMFYKKIPLMGGLLKIQRPRKLPRIMKLLPILKTYKVRTLAVEPDQKQNVRTYTRWCARVEAHCRVVRSGYMPTKTIRIDLASDEEHIFSRFSEAKRRAVRKAQKNGIVVTESSNIHDFIRIKNTSGGFLGFITTFGIDKLWPLFAPHHAAILLSYTQNHTLVGGVLLLFWNRIAYYWVAGATREGKKLFAPTLIVWEALKLSKKRGCRWFDFVGVWDERKDREHHDWKGFTKFKEGFGGKALYYPIASRQ